MKKVFLILGIAGLITSCSLTDDDGQSVNYEFGNITDVELPDTLVIGNRYSFPITSEVNNCSTFYGFDARQQDSTRFIGAVNRVLENTNCSTEPETVSNDFNFEVLYDYTYTFKFLTGYDADDEPIYFTRTVPVKERQ